MANGLYLSARRISITTTLVDTDVWVTCVNSSDITVYLPVSPYEGKVIYIKRVNPQAVTINGNGISIWGDQSLGGSFNISNQGRNAMLIYDGVYWQTQYLTP